MLLLLVAARAVPAQAQAAVPDSSAQESPSADDSPDPVDEWFAISDAAKESQPHWMTPLVTVTPRLEQEFRFDQQWQSQPGGTNVTSYGSGKGLELIPLPDTEVILGVPGYLTRQGPASDIQGWADESLLVKYRIASGNEEQGNYIVTTFLGVSLPTGTAPFTSRHAIYTPTLALGKGWGTRDRGFDIQTTVSYSIPETDVRLIGETLAWNTALQAHLLEVLWPEVEFGYTRFDQGPESGKKQLTVTGGLILGRFALWRRSRLIVGLGYQRPLSAFSTFGRTWLLTGRVAF